MIQYTIAPHDPEFKVEWLSGKGVLEGSTSRGFHRVQIVSYHLSLAEQFAARWRELGRREDAIGRVLFLPPLR